MMGRRVRTFYLECLCDLEWGGIESAHFGCVAQNGDEIENAHFCCVTQNG